MGLQLLVQPAAVIIVLTLTWSMATSVMQPRQPGLSLPNLAIRSCSLQPGSNVPTPTLAGPARRAVSEYNAASCQLDHEGTWSIGLFSGPSPLNLMPFQGLAVPGSSPAAPNPILTCASVTNPPSNFVADPFLWLPGNGSWYIFFETKTNTNNQGDIGVAESTDQGASWQYLGIALDKRWHLSYPFLFSWRGNTYMLPEAGNSRKLQLYQAAAFPLRWRPAGVLMNGSFAATTLVEWGGMWWMFTSPAESIHRSLTVLHIYYADNPLGPWTPHTLNPVKEDIRGARSAGRVLNINGTLLRFGQDGSQAYGHAVVAYQINKLSTTEFEQEEVPFHMLQTQPGTAAWNGVRHHHVDAQQMPDGSWLVAMDGDNRRN